MHLPLPGPVASWSVQAFARRYNIDLAEAEKPIAEYKTIGDLFTRKLKPGMRPLSPSPVVHPCDGELTVWGRISERQLLQAKGVSYSLETFVNDPLAFEKWRDGVYLTYYLCPTDYHRVHSPVSGKITSVDLIPGDLWPVNALSTAKVPNLFALNERVVVQIQTEAGPVCVVFVGATNVGKITLSFDETVTTNHHPRPSVITHLHYEFPRIIEKAAELGIFHMGSTVVVLYSLAVLKNLGAIENIKSGPVRMGGWFS